MGDITNAARQPDPRLEQDERYPSGPWTGFFLERRVPGRHWMELRLTFSQGRIRGNGRDRIGLFTFTGTYDRRDGTCHWVKRYVGRHDVTYRGFNEGKGIWGVWDIPPRFRGGFHIWPVGMGDPTLEAQTERVEEPVVVSRELALPTGPRHP